jgi:antitoxin ParD1/3/4
VLPAPEYQKLTTIVNSGSLVDMNVNLGPTFDQFVASLLETGLYQSQSEIVREGLRLLMEREQLKQLRLDELRREIAVGSAQADRGQFVDGKDAFRRIRAKSSRRRAAHKTAT